MAKQPLKADLARQNAALRAEVSQLKADLERALAHIQALESERRAKPAAPAKHLSRAQLMAHAKQFAQEFGCVTQIRDGQVQAKINGQWHAADPGIVSAAANQ